jgi:hypothetical protein
MEFSFLAMPVSLPALQGIVEPSGMNAIVLDKKMFTSLCVCLYYATSFCDDFGGN